jgi:signal transduction histidine kinase
MGSRGRSIRLRIFFLVAIPLIALVGLLAYVAGTTINNAISVDRAPNLVNATAIPAAEFGTFLEAERTAAVVYLFQPNAANLAAYQATTAATDKAEPAFVTAMNSGGTTGTENSQGAQAVSSLVSGLSQLPTLRNAVKARALSPLDALGAYSQGITTQIKLFLIQTESVTANSQQIQAVGLIATVQAREQLSQEEALLSGMLATKRITAKNRIAFADLAATRAADTAYANYILSPANLVKYNAALAGTGSMQQSLTGIEEAIAAGTPVGKLPVTQAQWVHLTGTLLTGEYNGGVAVAESILAADHQISHSAWVRVGVTSGIALLGLLITLLVTTLVARGIIRRLRGLEQSARTLAEDQLPDVIARLRRGEAVDMAAEAPPLDTGPGGLGTDEIGRVGQAFEMVRQTAVRSAVEESRLRQGLNDVFRSLARRSQSLLHRQLTLLDQMERRATDPEALDDLFRLDHLTTRMRRHAEGLVILAGAPAGRAWSSPVRMVDVMRGAIAEVEDYARVSVATRSQAALAGSAVADVIHLLAELVENATTLSPPYTSVRVAGDTVANGFAIEVEDRGLGMSAQRMAELNERLASPPEFNPSDSEQLGLFVVSQLAKRHGIRVTLKASPYGGTAAIVLIPQHLVVTEEAFRAGLPGEPAAIGPALTDGPLTGGALTGGALTGGALTGGALTNGALTNGALAGGVLAGRAVPGTNGNHAPAAEEDGFPEVPGARISGPLRRSPGGTPEGERRGAHHAAPRGAASPDPGMPPDAGLGLGLEAAGLGRDETANGAGQYPGFDVFTPRPRGLAAGDETVPYSPSAGTAPYAEQLAPFPGWTGRSVAGSAPPEAPAGPAAAADPGGATGTGGAAGLAGPAGPTVPLTPMTPVASPRAARSSSPPWELSRQTGPLPALPADGDAGAAPGGQGDAQGLPRRVRQASIAPQLRDNPPRRRTSAAPAPTPASGPTPAEIRQTMSALQRGWQEGRSQRAPDDDELRGDSDGT